MKSSPKQRRVVKGWAIFAKQDTSIAQWYPTLAIFDEQEKRIARKTVTLWNKEDKTVKASLKRVSITIEP